jgi:polyisoprenyl-phosphate glycosyltransferase
MTYSKNDIAPEISVVIPVYRSRDCLPELLRQLTAELDQLSKPFEIILVDDASPDDSWHVIRQLASEYPFVKAIQLMRNAGQAFATLCGLAHSRGEVVVTMDDDLQHQPDQLPKLLSVLDNDSEVDCVLGYFAEKKHARYRNLGSRAIRWVNARAFGLPSNIRSSSFRAIRRPVVRAILGHHTQNPAIAALLYQSTHRIRSLPIEHAARYSGESNYTLAKQFRLALDNICNVSMLPLRAVTVLGLAACAFSVLLVIKFLVQYLLGSIGVAGWTTVVILMSFFSGAILLSLGIVGEYLVRILREVRSGPPYIEREAVCSAEMTTANGVGGAETRGGIGRS